MKALPKSFNKHTGVKYDGRKLIAKLYLSKKCPHCKKAFEKIDKIKENFRVYSLELIVEFIDEGKEFHSHDFDSVPTLVIPFQRPFCGIAEAWLTEVDKVRKIVLGEVSMDDIQHAVAKERATAGISRSDKWWKGGAKK